MEDCFSLFRGWKCYGKHLWVIELLQITPYVFIKGMLTEKPCQNTSHSFQFKTQSSVAIASEFVLKFKNICSAPSTWLKPFEMVEKLFHQRISRYQYFDISNLREGVLKSHAKIKKQKTTTTERVYQQNWQRRSSGSCTMSQFQLTMKQSVTRNNKLNSKVLPSRNIFHSRVLLFWMLFFQETFSMFWAT